MVFGSGEQDIAMMVTDNVNWANFLESLYRNLRSPHPTVGQGQLMVPLAAALSLAPVHLILVMLTSNKINNNSNSLIKQLLFFPKKNFNQVI